MSELESGKPPRLSSGQIVKLVIGVVLFGVLMALRGDFEQMWVRAAIAACAGGVLGWVLLQAMRRHR